MAKKSFLDELVDESMELGEKVILGNLQNKCKAALDKGADMKQEDNPFYDLSDISSQFANKMMKGANIDPDKDPSKVYDELSGAHTSPSEKIELATYMNAYVREFGMDYTDVTVALNGQDNHVSDEIGFKISKFAEKYGVARHMDKPSDEFKPGKLANDHNIAIFGIAGVFNTKYTATEKGRKNLLVKGTKDTGDFAQGKLRQYHKDALVNDKEIENNPYFNKNNKEFGKVREKYALGKAMNSFIDLNDEKSATDKGLSNTRLSFGRKGSDQFKDMKDEYAQFKLALDNLRKDPSENNYMKLDESMAKLNEKVDAYLNYKNKQMDDKEIKSKIEKGPDGKDRKVPTNSNTRKRMDFAEALKQQMKDMKDAVKDVRQMYHEPVQMDVHKEAAKDIAKEAVKENHLAKENKVQKEKKYAKDDINVQKMSYKDFDQVKKFDTVRKRSNSVQHSKTMSEQLKAPDKKGPEKGGLGM